MKKNILFLAAMILILGILPSCSKDEFSLDALQTANNAISRASKSDQTLDSLMVAIDKYNAAFIGGNRNAALQSMLLASNSNTQRGFWGILKKICKVVIADAAGTSGGVIVGTASSIVAIIDQFGLDSANAKSLTLPTTCPFLLSQETGSIKGEAHNKVAYQVIKNNPNFAKMNEVNLYNAVVLEYQKLYDKTSLPSFAFASNLLNNVRTHLLENELNDEASWYIAWQQITQNQPKISKLVVDFTLNVVSIRENDDVRSYVKGYSKIVENSKVSTAEKSIIFDGTSVAANSRILWNASLSNME